MTVAFLHNPTSWRDGPVPGGMADCLFAPIAKHLESDWIETNEPQRFATNLYVSHRKKYTPSRPAGEKAVFMSHGIGDKAWRNPQRMIPQKWDYIFVSGPAWTMRYAESRKMDMARVIEAGYTKLDPIFNGEITAPQRDHRIRVVYAPTHGGGGEKLPGTLGSPEHRASRFSTHHARDEVAALLPESEFDLVAAPHPRHRPDGRSTLAEYVGADVVIADGGSTIYEAWALDLPVVFCDWLTAAAFRGARQTFEGQIYTNNVGWHAAEPADLARTVVQAAESGISDGEVEFIEPIFPRKYRGISGRLHAEALDDITNRAPVRHVAKVLTRWWRVKPGGWQKIETVRGTRQDRRFETNPRWEEVPA